MYIYYTFSLSELCVNEGMFQDVALQLSIQDMARKEEGVIKRSREDDDEVEVVQGIVQYLGEECCGITGWVLQLIII